MWGSVSMLDKQGRETDNCLFFFPKPRSFGRPGFSSAACRPYHEPPRGGRVDGADSAAGAGDAELRARRGSASFGSFSLGRRTAAAELQ